MAVTLFLINPLAADAGESVLRLETAVRQAQLNDPWLAGNRHSQDAVESLSVAAGTYPDPKMTLGLVNLATDSFDFNQEGMTQLKVGVSQMFPRGDSLQIRRKQLELIGSQFPFQRQDRKAKVVVGVSRLWLDTYLAQESIALIEKDRPLFEQLADVAEAGYSSAMGRIRQQDIIRAQLELTRLDDRLTVLRQKQETFVEKLSEWLSDYFIEEYSDQSKTGAPVAWASLVVDRKLPDIMMLNPSLYSAGREADPQVLYEFFSQHPVVAALDQKIEASKTAIELARQKYKPEWGINASYGYRDDDPQGNDRSDFLSVGIGIDLPLFTGNRQDKQVESAQSQAAAIKTEKWLLIRKMIADFEKSRTQLSRLNERYKLYNDELLPQMREQAEASLTAYMNDDGDFAEAVRARIAELNALIDSYAIDVAREKTIVQLNYFFMKDADDIIKESAVTGE
ncbi:MAG: TolC family protein [Deltaproteobacteria bacterium]|nr:TolC family protein [Deltaproteobacteria bacterium]MBW2658620.1 TolC family protein [Deltaproteobacteria bacterium]